MMAGAELATEGLVISSAEPLDDNTRDLIRNALAGAGIEQSVHFSDGSHGRIFMHRDGVGEMDIVIDVEQLIEQAKADGKQVRIIRREHRVHE